MKNTLTLALLLLATTSSAAELTQLQQEQLGEGSVLMIGGAYMMEIATTKECKSPTRKPVDHRVVLDAVLRQAPAAHREELRQAYLPKLPDGLMETMRRGRETLQRVSGESNRDFLCGATFGLGAANRSRGQELWKEATGVAFSLK